VFDIVEKSSKFLPEIITLVSSENEMGSDEVFIVDPCGSPCSTIPYFEENF
jgi:hypothetical protein